MNLQSSHCQASSEGHPPTPAQQQKYTICILQFNLRFPAQTYNGRGPTLLLSSASSYLNLLLLCIQHVGVDGERPQDAHHQLLLHQPGAQLAFGH